MRKASAKSGKSGSPADSSAPYWRTSLVLGAAVIGVVALLLETLTRTAERIEEGAAAIWQTGKLIATNTVHIPILIRINQNAEDILKASEGIGRAAERIGQAVGRTE